MVRWIIPKTWTRIYFLYYIRIFLPEKEQKRKIRKGSRKGRPAWWSLWRIALYFFDLDDNSRMLLPIHIQMPSHPLQLLQSGKKAPGWESHLEVKGAGSFHIHRKNMKELGTLAVLDVREQPNLAQNLVTHRHWWKISPVPWPCHLSAFLAKILPFLRIFEPFLSLFWLSRPWICLL